MCNRCYPCHFRNHPSVTEIKSKFMFAQSNAESSSSYTNTSHVAFLLTSLDIKKASGIDKIPPKLVKTASDILPVPMKKTKTNFTDEKIQITNEDIQIVPSVKLLGITIDKRLNFNAYVTNICKSAGNQLNALVRLRTFCALMRGRC